MAAFGVNDSNSNYPAYMKSLTFSPEEIASINALAEEGIEMLLANTSSETHNSDNNPWKLDFHKKELNLKVYSSDVNGKRIKRFKGTVIFLYISFF